MYVLKTLDVIGHRDAPVPNTFFRQETEARHLAIVFPGFGYNCDMPLLYYPTMSLLNRGADVLHVKYGYNQQQGFRNLDEDERERWIAGDVTAACDVVVGQRSYAEVTLIGKSIGTRAMGCVLTTDERFANARAVWLTPLLRSERLRAQVKQWGQRSLFVIGTADPEYDQACLADARVATGVEVVVIDGADHSLEIAANVLASVDTMRTIMQEIEAFLA